MRSATIAVLALFTAVSAIAQQKQPSILDVPALDLSVPESPAFTILGVTPHDVTRPYDIESLGVSLLNATDQHGVLQSGIAMESNPVVALAAPRLLIANYQKN